MRRVDSLEKTLMLGGIGGRRRRGWQRMRWLDGITDSMDGRVWVNSGSWWWTGVLQFVGSQRVGHDWATELNWMTNDAEHLFMCSLAICTFYCLFKSFVHFHWVAFFCWVKYFFIYLGKNRCAWGCGEVCIFIRCWWKWKMLLPLWQIFGQFLKKVKH